MAIDRCWSVAVLPHEMNSIVELKTDNYVIGVDPGKTTGVAFMTVDNGRYEIVDVMTTTFWELIDYARTLEKDRFRFVVEDGSMNRPVFHKAENEAAQNMTAKRVGGNHTESKLLSSGLSRMGFKVFTVKPHMTKQPARYIKQVTGFGGRTNQHTRDAIMMIWGKSWK